MDYIRCTLLCLFSPICDTGVERHIHEAAFIHSSFLSVVVCHHMNMLFLFFYSLVDRNLFYFQFETTVKLL